MGKRYYSFYKYFLFIFSTFFILTFFVNAACPDNQTILKLYSTNNSHGALWNDSNYQIKICFNEIFGIQGDGNRICYSKNKVLGLSSSTNAHAEGPNLTNYNINVCYSNLSCKLRDSCLENERCVVEISSNTNAHLSMCGFGQGYKKICCNFTSDSPDPSLSEAFWGNLVNGSRIDNISLGGTALMRVMVNNLTENDELNFSINKKIDSNWENLWNFFGLFSLKNLELVQDIASTPFTTLIDKNISAYKFKVKISSPSLSNEKISNELNILLESENFVPRAIITSPQDMFLFTNLCPIEFKHDSYDEDDLLKIIWDFGDGNITTAARNYSKFLTPNKGNINYTYNKNGNFRVKLIVMEEDNRQIDINPPQVDEISINVIKDGINLVPIISSPRHSEINRFYRFNASRSYVANCSSSINNPDFFVGEGSCRLNCSYILAPGENKTTKGKVYLRWRYSEDNKETWRFICPLNNQECNSQPNWGGLLWDEVNYTEMGGVIFTMPFAEAKERWIVLDMRYEN
ncbi:MAG: PKD domain-containing protein [Candidatus Pacearchaeota archaeon]